MFNFKTLHLDRRIDGSTDPFVGIRKSGNKIEFRLPIGFHDFPEKNFNETKKLFFRMYRTFKKFSNDRKKCWQDKKPKAKDSIEVDGNAYSFKDKNNESVTIYSKISMLEKILDTYKDLSINTIENQYTFTEENDFSRIERYLHKAIYFDDNTIYIDQMQKNNKLLLYGTSELIELFCFITYEIKQELEEEQELDKFFVEKYKIFKEKNLSYDQSLFNETTFNETTSILKEILSDIDKKTVYKGNDYWMLYEAIENFLYGELDMENAHEDGIFWGISNFYQIWEDMCNTYMFNKSNDIDIIYADTIKSVANPHILQERGKIKNIGGHSVYCKNKFNPPFYISLNEKSKYLRPDLLRKLGQKNDSYFFDKKIKIIITVKSPSIKKIIKNNTINFKVILKSSEPKIKKIYNKFIKDLRYRIEEYRFSGAGFRNGLFVSYPENHLNEEKEKILSIFESNSYLLIDWKYCNLNYLLNRKYNIYKQLAYEFCLSQYLNEDISSQFVLPHWNKREDYLGDEINKNKLPDDFIVKKISVFEANFQKIQKVYLKNDN